MYPPLVPRQVGGFTRQKAQYLIPRTNPFLRRFFFQITGPDLDEEPYAGFVNDLVQVLAQADMDAILADLGSARARKTPPSIFTRPFWRPTTRNCARPVASTTRLRRSSPSSCARWMRC